MSLADENEKSEKELELKRRLSFDDHYLLGNVNRDRSGIE